MVIGLSGVCWDHQVHPISAEESHIIISRTMWLREGHWNAWPSSLGDGHKAIASPHNKVWSWKPGIQPYPAGGGGNKPSISPSTPRGTPHSHPPKISLVPLQVFHIINIRAEHCTSKSNEVLLTQSTALKQQHGGPGGRRGAITIMDYTGRLSPKGVLFKAKGI